MTGRAWRETLHSTYRNVLPGGTSAIPACTQRSVPLDAPSQTAVWPVAGVAQSRLRKATNLHSQWVPTYR